MVVGIIMGIIMLFLLMGNGQLGGFTGGCLVFLLVLILIAAGFVALLILGSGLM